MFRMKGKDDTKPADDKAKPKPDEKAAKPADDKGKPAPKAGPPKDSKPVPKSGPPQAGPAGPPTVAPDGPPDLAGGPPVDDLGAGGPPLSPDPAGLPMAPPMGGMGEPRHPLEKLNPITAGYLGGEQGPFICGRCVHFDGAGSCDIVNGPIDPNGVCHVWEPNENPGGFGPPDLPGETEPALDDVVNQGGPPPPLV